MAIGNPITLTNNVASKTISVTATADQTLFTVTGGYRINQLAVFRNGVRLADGADFTARDGSSVTLLTPANLEDNLEFQVFDDFRVADAIAAAAASQTINGDLTVTGNLLGASIGIGTASTNLGFNGFSYLGAPFGATVNFAVTVAAKTAAHRYNGTGSSNGYVIDDVESPFLTLTPGRTYRFTLSSGDMTSHPFRFYLEADKTTAYTTNVTSTATYTEIVVTDSTPQVLHYQCSAHGYMGNSVQTNSNIASVATNATNAQGLTGTPDIAVRNITGVAATFTGVLTYEDVTNIDSVGIITAQSDVVIADKIIHLGDTNTAIRFPAADTFTVETAGSERLRVDSSGNIGIANLSPTNARLLIGDDLGAITAAARMVQIGHTSGGMLVLGKDNSSYSYLHHDPASSTSKWLYRGGNGITLDSSGRLLVGTSSVEQIVFGGTANAGIAQQTILGSDANSLGLFIKTTSTTASIGGTLSLGRSRSTAAGIVSNGDTTGSIQFLGADGTDLKQYTSLIKSEVDGTPGTNDMPGRLIFSTTADGASSPTERLRITSAGVVRIPDGGKLSCGTGDDLEIEHTGSGSFIRTSASATGDLAIEARNTGDLYLSAADDIFIRPEGSQNGIIVNGSAAVELYHANSKKLETSSAGVTVTGTVSDSIGPLRRLGTSAAGGSSYTLVASDAGKQVRVSGNYTITVPDDVFSTGDMITITAHTSSNVTITQGSGVSLYNASDGTTGSKTLASRTVCTIFVAEGPDKMYIAGGGIS